MPHPTDEQQRAPALKEIFNAARMQHIAEQVQAVHPAFDTAAFLGRACAGLESLSIMQRMQRVSDCLHEVLALDYLHALEVLYQVAPRLNSRFVTISLPQYVATHGQGHLDVSLEALRYFTGFGSSEFAIRHFLLTDFDRTLAVMQGWSRDGDEHVRRLASEGCRPRLPWSFRLARVQAAPERVMPILEGLRADDSLYVRKSVANHLNDISKDHPDFLLDHLAQWPQDDPRTAWIVRHALRTLIKQGNRRALAIIGAGQTPEVEVLGLRIEPQQVRLGDSIRLSFSLHSQAQHEQRLVVDYAIDYVKKTGSTASKVFKLSMLNLAGQGQASLGRSQQIRQLTTRIHYPGRHCVHVLVNGERLASTHFDLLF